MGTKDGTDIATKFSILDVCGSLTTSMLWDHFAGSEMVVQMFFENQEENVSDSWQKILNEPFTNESSRHVETIQSIFSINRLMRFYMIRKLFIKVLTKSEMLSNNLE